MSSTARTLLGALILASLGLSGLASGIWAPGLDAEECALEPLSPGESTSLLRVTKAIGASCTFQVEVNGTPYSVGVGRFLDEAKLDLRAYSKVTRANTTLDNPVVWALAGVDPSKILLIEGSPAARDNLGNQGQYMILWGADRSVPPALCGYADPTDIQYPAVDCPLDAGRAYEIELPVECGLGGVIATRIGGDYWEVTAGNIGDGTAAPPGMAGPMDYGTVELRDDGTLIYRSEQGPVFTLTKARDHLAPAPCIMDLGF
ncbi:MAG: hypothetical protein ACRDHD_03220 [Candidatus Limnocylindria bacterium]